MKTDIAPPNKSEQMPLWAMLVFALMALFLAAFSVFLAVLSFVPQ
jgi:hypothetical protein